MAKFTNQYKALFVLSWIVFYLIFPSWALPISTTARVSVFLGLIIFFCIAIWLMNCWFSILSIDKPVIVHITKLREHFKGNLLLVIVCCLAALLHVKPILFPILIIGDETLHLQSGLWIYEFIESKWHTLFQILFWGLIGLLILVRKKRASDNFTVDRSGNNLALSVDGLQKYYFVFLLMGFLTAYFILLQNMPYLITSVRYPPVSKFIYFFAYSAFGINHIFPRIIQLIFYLLCSLYIYRSINLFYDKDTASLGATIYLFLPVVFSYASLGELASGEVFFIVLISFYFIRFIKEGDNRDLLLTAYLIGTGYLYKDPILLMFVICSIFLIVHKIRKHHLHSWIDLKILSLSLVFIIPWMIISKNFNWRNYTFQLSNLTSLDGKIVTYSLLLLSNLSGIIFILFILSVIYICCYKRNILTVFFGVLFITFYFAIVSDIAALSPRLSMPCYPTIAVFLALFISSIIHNIKWRQAVKICTVVLTIYLIIICSMVPLNNRFLTIMNKQLLYFPSEEAMKWVKENVKNGEKILNIRILSANFYRVKYGIDKNKLVDFMYEINEVSTPEKLKTFYKQNKISYVMFPYSAEYIKNNKRVKIFEYLKENPNKEFDVIAEFHLRDNFIFIYKLNN